MNGMLVHLIQPMRNKGYELVIGQVVCSSPKGETSLVGAGQSCEILVP